MGLMYKEQRKYESLKIFVATIAQLVLIINLKLDQSLINSSLTKIKIS